MVKPKQWKNDGEQDKFLEKLIDQAKVNKFTKPATLKNDYPAVFGEFTENVIRNHFNVIKRNKGLHLDEQPEYDGEDIRMGDVEMNGKETLIGSYEKNGAASSGIDNIIHQNYPVLCEQYKDPDNQYDKVIIAVTVPSGAQKAQIELNDDGTMAVIKYVWAKSMFDMEDLFKKQLSAKRIDLHHPKILALKNGLEKVRKRIDLAPDSFIKVTLPMKVQTASDSWTQSGLKREDGTQMVVAEFKGYIKDYVKKLTDSTVIFDM